MNIPIHSRLSRGRTRIAAIAFLALVAGCIPLSKGGPRPVKVLMPEINAHFSALKRLATSEPLPAVPERNFNSLLSLFEELKASPNRLYTQDPAAWERACRESVDAVRAMESAWRAGDKDAVAQSLQLLMMTRDDAHNQFSGRRPN